MVRTEIEIAASPGEVRVVLLDFARLPEWHSALIQSLRPSNAAKPGIEKGDKLDAVLGHVRVHPTVTENTPERLSWYGQILLGLFAGEHYFLFQPSRTIPGGTTLVHGEHFGGLIWFLFLPGWPLYSPTLKLYEQMSKDLKARVESLHARG